MAAGATVAEREARTPRSERHWSTHRRPACAGATAVSGACYRGVVARHLGCCELCVHLPRCARQDAACLEQGLEVRADGGPSGRDGFPHLVGHSLVRDCEAHDLVVRVVSNVTTLLPSGNVSPGASKVMRSRWGGSDVSTVPITSAMPDPSTRSCFHVEPTCQSETLLCPQYLAVRSASVNASQTRSAELSMYVT
jgi:hypothetical protein